MATTRELATAALLMVVPGAGAIAPAAAQSGGSRPGLCTAEDCLPSIEKSLRSIAASLKLLAEQGRMEGMLASYRAADEAVRHLEAERLAAVKERADLVGTLDAEIVRLEALEEAIDDPDTALSEEQLKLMIAQQLRGLQPVEKKVDALSTYIRTLEDEIAIKAQERDALRDRLQNVR